MSPLPSLQSFLPTVLCEILYVLFRQVLVGPQVHPEVNQPLLEGVDRFLGILPDGWRYRCGSADVETGGNPPVWRPDLSTRTTNNEPRQITAEAVCGPEDNGESVTTMFHQED